MFDCEHPDDGYQAVCPLCGALRTPDPRLASLDAAMRYAAAAAGRWGGAPPPLVRPGPLSIAPRACPGGVVIHVWAATVPPLLLLTQRVGPADDVEAAAERAALEASRALEADAAVCLVAYDGDTGARFSGPDWLRRPE